MCRGRARTRHGQAQVSGLALPAAICPVPPHALRAVNAPLQTSGRKERTPSGRSQTSRNGYWMVSTPVTVSAVLSWSTVSAVNGLLFTS